MEFAGIFSQELWCGGKNIPINICVTNLQMSAHFVAK